MDDPPVHPNDKLIYNDPPAGGIGDVTLRLKTLIHDSGKGTIVSGGGALKVPLGSEDRLLGSGGWDKGAELFLSQKGGRSWFHMNLSYYDIEKPLALPLPVRDSLNMAGAWELTFGEELSLLVQILFSRGYFPDSDTHSMDEVRGEACIGVKGRMGRKSRYSISLLEDLTRHGNTIDVGVLFGFEFYF